MADGAPFDQHDHHHRLRPGHQEAGRAGGAIDAQLHRQRADAHLLVALDRLEVVERHDAVRTHAVEQGQQHRPLTGPAAGGHHRGTGDPGQALVRQPAGRIAPPAVAFQAQRRGAVGPGQQQAHGGGGKAHRAQHQAHRQRQQRPQHRDVQPPAARHAPRGDRAVGFVDGVDMAIEPVVHRLAGGAHQRAGQQHAHQHQAPAVGHRCAGGHHPAPECPHRREPGDRLEQFGDGGQCRPGHASILQPDTQKCQPGFTGVLAAPRGAAAATCRRPAPGHPARNAAA